MSMHEKIWSKLPEKFNFVVWDEGGFSGFCQRPVFDREANCWISGNSKQPDWQDIRCSALPRPFQRLSRLSARVAILQRPSSWDGELRAGDAVKVRRVDHMFTVNGFFNNEKIWLESSQTSKITITALDKIVLVNGMGAKGKLFARVEIADDHPGLPPEVYNNAVVDADKAMDILRRMCRN
ncbi:hypothetical protein [Endozoicomonas sp. Mp262]|uniref:hypothetical protein n=1 Tax=Endozoicomonas sp. Mp262 TaxID=2919499 RepID=UPI0021DA7CB6